MLPNIDASHFQYAIPIRRASLIGRGLTEQGCNPSLDKLFVCDTQVPPQVSISCHRRMKGNVDQAGWIGGMLEAVTSGRGTKVAIDGPKNGSSKSQLHIEG